MPADNQHLTDLANAYRALREAAANVERNLYSRPPSPEQVFQQQQLEQQFNAPPTPDVTPPPREVQTTLPNNIEGGTRVSRPETSESVRAAIRRTQSTVGTLELPPPTTGNPNTTTPAYSAPREPWGTPNGRGLQGGATFLGVDALVSAATAMLQGHSPTQAAASAVAGDLTTIGVLTAASALGVTGGLPAIAAVVTALGAGRIASSAVSSLFGQPQPQTRTTVVVTQPPPFRGGQCTAYYKVDIEFNRIVGGLNYPDRNVQTAWGPIRFSTIPNDDNKSASLIMYCHNNLDGSYNSVEQPIHVGLIGDGGFGNYSIASTTVSRLDGQIDNCGDPAPVPSIGTPTSAPQTTYNQPVGDLGQPEPTRAIPQGDRPSEQARRMPTTVVVPPNNPAQVSHGNNNPVTVPASSQPGTIRSVPSPNNTQTQVQQQGQQTYTFSSPGSGRVTIAIPGHQPVSIDPTGKTAPQNLTANPSTSPTTFSPIPLHSPTTPTQPTQTPTTPDTAYLDLLNKLQAIALGITALGVGGQAISNKLNGIAQNTTPNNLANAAATGTCQTLQPGGCMTNLANNAEQAAQNSETNKNLLSNLFNNLANLGELNLLGPMNGKLDGITNLLTAFRKRFEQFLDWSKPGRLLDIFTFLVALHNAFMLSQAAKQTIIQVLEDWIKVVEPAFGIDPDKNPLNLNQLLDKTIEQFFEGMLGEEATKKYEQLFKSLNRIYQSATNLLVNIQMLFFSVTMALETIGHGVGVIGNALKKYGVVGHHAYPWLNPNPDYKNKWIGSVEAVTQKITGFIAGAFAVDLIAQGILQGRQAVDQIGEEKNKIREEIKTAYEEKEDIDYLKEHKPVFDAAVQSALNSKGTPPTEQTIQDLNFLR